MAESYVDKVANELADMALADQKASGDIGIVDAIGDVLGASSQTLQETYLTAVRVRRAEERARQILAERIANNYADAPKPKAAPLQGVSEEETDEIDATVEEPAEEPEAPVEDATPSSGTAPMMPRRVKR